MKNLILLALICFSVNAACAEGERIFSVVANETTTAEGAKSTLYFNHEPGAINLPDRTRGERIQNKHCVLINDRGALSKQIKRLRNFSLYNPVKYHAEIDGANAKAIISPLEGSIGEFSSFNARLYIALYPDAFIECSALQICRRKKRPQNLGRLNKIFRFVDGPFHTVEQKKNRIG